MNLWSVFRGFFGGQEQPPPSRGPLEGVRWLPSDENPFGVDVLDCRSFSQRMLAFTDDPQVAENFTALRVSKGDQYRGCTPHDSRLCTCDLRYPPSDGETREGPIFKAKEMEDKWDIYLYDGHLYFVRSWTGSLEYRAQIVFHPEAAHVVAVEAPKALVESDASYPVAVVDYLIRSHIGRMQIPHPLPRPMGQDPQELALFSFSQYGRHGLFGTYADTTRIPAPRRAQAGPSA